MGATRPFSMQQGYESPCSGCVYEFNFPNDRSEPMNFVTHMMDVLADQKGFLELILTSQTLEITVVYR